MDDGYYYLIASLPELAGVDKEKKHPFPPFFDFCNEELRVTHRGELAMCFLFNDVKNVVSVAADGYDHISPSFYDRETLLEGLKDPDLLFPFFADYLYEKRERSADSPGMGDEASILRDFYSDVESYADGFVRDYLTFELDCRNIGIAGSRRAVGAPYRELIIPGNDVAEQVVRSTAPDFGLAGEIELFEPLLDGFGSTEPMEVEKKIDLIRWQWLDEYVDYRSFSKEAVYAYAIKLAGVERWLALDETEGRRMLDALIEQVKESV